MRKATPPSANLAEQPYRSSTLTVGVLTEFLAFMAILQQPVRQIGMIVNATARGSISGKRVFEVIDLEPAILDKPDASGARAHPRRSQIRARRLQLRPERRRAARVARHHFRGRAGQDAGYRRSARQRQILPRPFDPALLRRHCGPHHHRRPGHTRRDAGVAAHQRRRHATGHLPVSAPIESNIAYGEPEAAQERITDAAELAQLHDYVQRLPYGYETLIGERGLNLSGGQRQRLSIARSILPSPGVIVFDDSTASVDAGTEQSCAPHCAISARSARRSSSPIGSIR